MNNQNRPEIITVEDQNFGSHVEHWNLLTDNPTSTVPQWLGLALNAPIMPMGICKDEGDMDTTSWLIQGPSGQAVQLSQVIAVEDNKPKAVKTAFPSFESPYITDAKAARIDKFVQHFANLYNSYHAYLKIENQKGEWINNWTRLIRLFRINF